MQIQINSGHNIEVHEALVAEISGAVESALSRFCDHITQVEVHLSDENSDKKGGNDDMRCVMEARLEGRQPIAVTHHASTLDEAVDGAADKLTRLIEHTLGRARSLRVAGPIRLCWGRPMIDRTAEVSEMNMQEILDTANALVADDKGLLAMEGKEA
ncbi:ribosome-associated translation inhibitor RaiA [Candidatus Sumerlaeota bacterium]|nr:ribosome-associated translation inhibitor RaiA [Candidatus Sumerlaeota bacterium]